MQNFSTLLSLQCFRIHWPKMLWWSLILFLDILINVEVFADENNSPSAYITTRENKRLSSHMVTKFESLSVISCSQSCLRNPWCTSTNFQDSSGLNKGTCELNRHEFAPINDDTKLVDEPGTTFSMFLKGCLMTGCLNGGSCLFAKETGTFACSCTLQWGGETCACRAVGVEDKDTITDDQMTASSEYDDGNYHPYYGRLNVIRGGGAWCPKERNKEDDYLQVDIGTEYSICAVATQGEAKSDSWAKSYKLHFSLDNTIWETYKEANVDKVFTGNIDRNSVVKNSLKNEIKARYVRFNAVETNYYGCFRVEIYVGNAAP